MLNRTSFATVSATATRAYACVRVLPVLAICPPRALPKTTLTPEATLRDVAQVVDAFSSTIGDAERFHTHPISRRAQTVAFGAKFVPRPSQVAPSGYGAPPKSHALLLRDEKNCSKGRNNKADLGDHAFVQRTDGAAVPDIGAAVAVGIGIENLAPNSGEWNLDPVIPIDLGREIDHHQAALARLASLTQPSKNTALGVMHDQPLESGAVAVELVQCRQSPVEMVEVADQSLNACMPWPLSEMPIERVVVPPFVFLAELSAHEQKLLAGMAEHETVIGAQICKALPFVARHAAEDGALAVHDLVMGESGRMKFSENA